MSELTEDQKLILELEWRIKELEARLHWLETHLGLNK